MKWKLKKNQMKFSNEKYLKSLSWIDQISIKYLLLYKKELLNLNIDEQTWSKLRDGKKFGGEKKDINNLWDNNKWF